MAPSHSSLTFSTLSAIYHTCYHNRYILYGEKKDKESWNNNTLNLQLVSGAARPQGSIIKNGRIQK